MSKVVIFLIMALAAALVACGSGQEAELLSNQSKAQPGFASSEDAADFASPSFAAGAPAPLAEAAAEKAVRAADGGFTGNESGGNGQSLQAADRKVISTASISLEVEDVEPTIKRVQAVIEGMGGFVENLSSSGGSRNGEQYANMTLRVPQDRFLAAVEAVEDLGVVQNRNLGSEDVSERFIDLEARLKSSLREEQSLLSLLERTNTVSEILTVERELARVRSEVERFQGQLNFLERRVDLATIHLSMFPPQGPGGQPPSAALGIEVSDVGKEVNAIKGLVGSFDGTVDGVFLSLKDGRERADVTVRVFAKDFDRTVAFLEESGKVKTKELTEGKAGPDDEAADLKPNARIQVSFNSKEGGAGRILAVAVPIVGILLAAAFGYLVVRWLRRLARRRKENAAI